MSGASFDAGHAQGQAQAKASDLADSAKGTINSAKDKITDTAQCASDCSAQQQQHAEGFLQQTGQQVKSMAQGAVDGVKNTLGVGQNRS